MASMGRALGSGLTQQKAVVMEYMGPAAWEARLWWLLHRTVLLPATFVRRLVRLPSALPPPNAKMRELRRRLGSMEHLIVSSQGLEFAMDGMIDPPPPRALMQGLRLSLLAVSRAAIHAVSGCVSPALFCPDFSHAPSSPSLLTSCGIERGRQVTQMLPTLLTSSACRVDCVSQHANRRPG
jgi:hypothetical protein